MEYKIATEQDLIVLWNKNIQAHPKDDRWKVWKEEYISANKSGFCVTFVAVDKEPVGEVTLILSPKMSAIKNNSRLCDGKETANMNAFRIEKQFEGKGHISMLVKMAENYAKSLGINFLTIGVEAKETRNLAIYLHFGYDRFLFSEIEDEDLVLYYLKDLRNGQKTDNKITLNKKKKTNKLSKNSKYFDFYDDIKSGCHKVVDW